MLSGCRPGPLLSLAFDKSRAKVTRVNQGTLLFPLIAKAKEKRGPEVLVQRFALLLPG
jgi:hypothetical protein